MNSSPRRLLVLEDEKEISDCLKEFLESENLSVQTAGNGKEALDILKYSPLPDLILLDMKMPEMNGWQFASEFHRLYGKSIPILVMSAAAQVELRAKEVGASEFIGKPFDLNDLIQKIHSILEKSKTEKKNPATNQKPTEPSKSV